MMIMSRFVFVAFLLFVIQVGGSVTPLSSSAPSPKDADPNYNSINTNTNTTNSTLSKRSSSSYSLYSHNLPLPLQRITEEDSEFGRNIPTNYHFRDQPQAVQNANKNNQVVYSGYTASRGWCLYRDVLPRNPAESYFIADHMLEIQLVTKTMNAANVDMNRYSSGEISAMKAIMNGQRNVFYIPTDQNCIKTHITKRMLEDILTSGRCRPLDLSILHKDWVDHNALKTYAEGACQDTINAAKTMVPLIRSAGYDHALLNIDDVAMKILKCIGVDVRKVNGQIRCPEYKICKP